MSHARDRAGVPPGNAAGKAAGKTVMHGGRQNDDFPLFVRLAPSSAHIPVRLAVDPRKPRATQVATATCAHRTVGEIRSTDSKEVVMTVDQPIPRPRHIRDNTPRESELLTVADAAGRLGVPVRFIRRLIAERRIRFYKIGRHVRIDSQDLDVFIEAGRVDPPHVSGR
jgi:excisionase family DNA binding protein